MTGTMRKLVLLLTAVVCFAMLTSVLFIAGSAGHDCTHEDCAICYHVSICTNMLRSFALIFVLLVIVMAAGAAFVFPILQAEPRFTRPTLITNKVKLSN